MTYDDAVKYLSSHHWELTEDQARGLLDAIGYPAMQERIDSFEVDGAIDERYIEKVRDERDTARALADQLAVALHEVIEDEPVGLVEGDKYHDTDSYGRSKCGCSWDSGPYPTWCGRHDPTQHAEPALKAWEARDWRPISPPGSGLDGLLTDIRRTHDE